MKKIFLLFAGLSLSLCTIAQNTNVTTRLPQNHNLEGGGSSTDNSGFGIKGGVNFNQLRGNDKGSIDNITTWHAGIYGQFPVAGSSFFSIQPEILFNRRGFKAENAGEEVEIKSDYLELPFLFVFNFFDHVGFHIGPQVGALLTVKENEREVGGVGSTKDRMNSFVYGAAAGLEGRLSIARIGARYHLGLYDIYKEPSTVAQKPVEDLKNGQFQVYVGVGF